MSNRTVVCSLCGAHARLVVALPLPRNTTTWAARCELHATGFTPVAIVALVEQHWSLFCDPKLVEDDLARIKSSSARDLEDALLAVLLARRG